MPAAAAPAEEGGGPGANAAVGADNVSSGRWHHGDGVWVAADAADAFVVVVGSPDGDGGGGAVVVDVEDAAAGYA